MQCFISIRYQGNKDTQDNIDEQRDEHIEVDLGEDESRQGEVLHLYVSVEHIVSVNERKQTLGSYRRISELNKKKQQILMHCKNKQTNKQTWVHLVIYLS